MKPAGARTPPVIAGRDDLIAVLNKSLRTREELQPYSTPPLEDNDVYQAGATVRVDTQRSYASLRSTLRYTLLDTTTAIKAGRGEPVGWEASFVRDPDSTTNLLLAVRGWFRRHE